MALKKICKCGKIISIEKKMCEDCLKKYEGIQRKNYINYRRKRTDYKEQRFYSSKEWIVTRDIRKQSDKGLCRLCLSKQKINTADTVHHITTLKDDYSKRTALSNLICLCNRCHNSVHRAYEQSRTAKEDMQLILSKLQSESVTDSIGRGI